MTAKEIIERYETTNEFTPYEIRQMVWGDVPGMETIKEIIIDEAGRWENVKGTIIKIGDRYNYIDLLLFNYEFNCFVVVELKVTELKKEHIGQIEFYMNYIDNNLKKLGQDKTIGIIICKKENKYVIEYCSDDRIIAREYELI